MSREDRLEQIKKLEDELESPVITYVTSTRKNLEAQMGMDAIRFIYEHLAALDSEVETLNLFIHSNGGDGIVPWKLVTLLRERCERLRVLVPYRAFSAATLTALGADEIFMHPMGMLGPTDPSITGPYNPRDAQGNLLPISVEEVLSYIALVREDVGINHEDELVQAFNHLASQVHPIALGSVKRTHAQSRMLAQKLMQLVHDRKDEHAIEEIVQNLTSRLYYHGHPINREEAKQMGLVVKDCTQDVEDSMWALYEMYEDVMDLLDEFHTAREFIRLAPGVQPGQSQLVDVPKIHLVFVESRERCDSLVVESKIFGQTDQNGGTQTQMYTHRQSWERCD